MEGKRMKKIPTVFIREFENHKLKRITEEFANEECKEAFLHGRATEKWDGSCCAMIGDDFYKRFDYNIHKNRKLPAGAIPCQDKPDALTGHWPHWVPCRRDNPADKWFWAAYDRTVEDLHITGPLPMWSWEAIGKHFNGNPYKLDYDKLVLHGYDICNVERTFEGVYRYLKTHYIEGLVFWHKGEPVCKIKRSDFGMRWADE